MIYKRKQFGDKDFRRRFSKINGIKIIPHPNLSGDWDRYTPSNWWWSINPDLVNFIEVKQCFESLTSEECDEYKEEIRSHRGRYHVARTCPMQGTQGGRGRLYLREHQGSQGCARR